MARFRVGSDPLLLEEPCLHCGALPGVPCITSSGRPSIPHGCRWDIRNVKNKGMGLVDGRAINQWSIPVGGFIEPPGHALSPPP